MYKCVNTGVFLFNNLASLTFEWLSRILAVKLAQIGQFLDYICSHLRERSWELRACLVNTPQHTVFFLVHHSTMPKHTQNIDPLERPGKRAKIQPTPKVVAPQSKAKQVQVLTEASPHQTASAKGKEKAINPPSVSLKKKKQPTDNTNPPLPTSFKVVAGSYEKLLYGLDGTITVDDQSNLKFHLKPIFIFPAHVSCIKSVAASPYGGKWLATGSADEIIKVWDLKRRKEIGGLMHHEGQQPNLPCSW
jgi:WD40 repeat protein